MDDKLQNDDFLLAGGLGNMTIGSTGEKRTITKLVKNNKDKSVTITLSAVVNNYLNGVPVTEDADFEIIQPKKLNNG